MEEFAAAWKNSNEHAKLIDQIDLYNKKYRLGGPYVDDFTASRRAQQAVHQ